MNGRIAVIGDKIMVDGFMSIGIKDTFQIDNDKQLKDALDSVIKNNEIALVIIQESLVDRLNQRDRDNIQKSVRPLFIEIPGFNEKEVHTERLRDLILRALGIDISNRYKI
ncbi:MAG: V-type ATP synthase subunit F [Candidatus Micrarchaeota archaeon]|nr:MAG: V-type ATP synthase subunit F [Candidatus Micrarchaeota archaeon]